jgi:hypothetical protein
LKRQSAARSRAQRSCDGAGSACGYGSEEVFQNRPLKRFAERSAEHQIIRPHFQDARWSFHGATSASASGPGGIAQLSGEAAARLLHSCP